MNKEHIENLEKKITTNAKMIENNAQKIQYNTGALEILQTFKSYSQVFFIMWFVTFISLLCAIGYILFIK